jgi:ClpP class serine protease
VFFVQLGLGPREELRPHSRTLLRLAAGRFGFLVGRLFAVKHSVLGPVDPQLGQSPAASLLKVIEQKPVKEVDDQTLVLADVGRKAIAQLKDAARELLARRLPADQAQTLADKLSGGTWMHDYPIRPGEARELGLPISTEMPKEVLELMTLYPQPMRTQRAVEYLPAPRQRQPPA